jgi:sulfate adenylyltransferase subunit 1
MVLPSGFSSKIKTLQLGEEPLKEAFAPMSVTMTLEDEIDISRGDIIAKPNNQPKAEQDIDVMICWMNQQPARVNSKYFIRHSTKEVKGVIKEIQYKMDINSLNRDENAEDLKMNDIARVRIRTSQPLFFDSYRKNRFTGSLILVAEGTNETVGAGMIV